jgi:DNA polymerase III delta prime subunit
LTCFNEIHCPKNINEVCLPKRTKLLLKTWIQNPDTTNIIFHGECGIGKSLSAKLLARGLSKKYPVAYEPLRNFIHFTGGEQSTIVKDILSKMNAPTLNQSYGYDTELFILDDFDRLKPRYQEMFRYVLEIGTDKRSIIITVNDIDKIVPSIKSRCSHISYDYLVQDKPSIVKQLLKRASFILDAENIQYTPEDLQTFVDRYWDQPRQLIQNLQTYSAGGLLMPA